MDFSNGNLSNFFVAGINHKHADAAARSQFSVNQDQYEQLLQLAPFWNVSSLFVLSTCNRTEVYGFAENANELIELLCSQTKGTAHDFRNICYQKSGLAAVEHLYKVGAGLDSQILGDYEIIGQLKQAVKFAKDRNRINPVLERIINGVLQCSKAIKNNTVLCTGTVSVSFSAVQYIKEYFKVLGNRRILVIGTGKIGRNTCKNLIDYLGTRNIVLMNRSVEKAADMANELGVSYAPLDELDPYLTASDIVITATSAPQPILTTSNLRGKGEKLVLDLSIPYNVEALAGQLSNITLVNVDELSKSKDETLHKRALEAPKALQIVAEQVAAFAEWNETRKYAPALKLIKNQLRHIYEQQASLNSHKNIGVEQQIQRIVKRAATKMRNDNQEGCQYLNAINEFLSCYA